MKKTLAVAVLFIALIAEAVAQAPPNLENGFKAWGSYDSSHVDTVNLLNGNQMLHAPLLPNYPQRGGSLTMQPFLYQTSKNWQLYCSTDLNGNSACSWGTGRAGVDLRPSVGLTLQRTIHEDGSGTGTVRFSAFGYSLQDASGTMHRMSPTGPSTGPTTEYDSIDTSGYHLHLSNPDSYGVMQSLTVTDRHGNQYTAGMWLGGTDTGPALCPSLPGNRLPSGGGGMNGMVIQPIIDDAPFGQQDCPQVAFATQVTDSNGNLISFDTATDTLGRTMPFLNPGVQTTDPSGCSTNHTFAYALTYTYAAPDGGTPQLKLCYAYIPISAFFGGPWASTVTASSLQLVTVVLGDGTKWTFDYDNYGEVTKIGLPTGGSINYTWTTIAFPSCAYPDGGFSRAAASRTLIDNNDHSFTWNYHWGTVVNGVISNFVTDPLGNDTVHIFTALDGTGLGACNFFETRTQYFQGTGSSHQLLKQVDTGYSTASFNIETSSGTGLGNVVPIGVQTTIYPSSKVSRVEKTYAPSPYPGGPFSGAVRKLREYDWGSSAASAPLLRETDTVYKWQKDSAYLTAGLIDLPASVVVVSPDPAQNVRSNCPIDASGGTANCATETDYYYDEPGYLSAPTPAISTQHVGAPYSVRGNQTTTSKWLSTNNTFISSHTYWYDTGEPYQTKDPLGHTTTYTYDPFYKGAYATQTCSPSTTSPTGSITHCVSGTYDFSTGVLTSFSNENASQPAVGNTPGDAAHTSLFSYDKVFHLVQAQGPADAANGNARATTSFTYSSNSAPTSYPFTITRSRSVTNTANDIATNTFDGLGRLIKSQHTMPSGPPSTVDTTYDELGRVGTVSNPYFATSDLTYGITQTIYDAFDRPVLVQKPDGSFSTVTYQDNCTMAEDETGKGRRTCTDALGRLIQVEEPGDSSAPAATDTSTVNTQATAIVSLSGAEQSFTTGGDQYCAMWNNMGECVDWEANPPVTTYDSGTVTVKVNGRETSVSYGMGDTASGLASRLASAINADSLSVVTASASGTQITLTAKSAGQTGDYTASFSSTWDTLDFGSASFTGLVSNLRLLGGADLNQFAHTYLTLYNYDTLGNLLCVEQHGNSPAGLHADGTSGTGCSATPDHDATSTWRVRRFTYDSFSRLLTAKNPEAGTISYTYDDDSNLKSKTDARGIAINYSPADLPIDELHRVRKKTYSNGDPAVTFTYDNAPNAKGKLVSLTDPAGSASYSYDTLGRMTGESRMIFGVGTNQITKSLSYTYNLGGSLNTLTYPSGAVVTYTPWTNGPVGVDATIEAKDTGNSINYVTAATYGPDGAITGFKSGQSPTFAGITNTFNYNNRLQPINMSASSPSQTVFSIGYDFHWQNGDNGNVYGITNYKDPNRNQTFTYDPLNRLISAQNAGTNCARTTANNLLAYWGNTYTYDAWGNLTNKTKIPTACAGENLNVAPALVNNQLPGYGYDAAGNMTNNVTDGVTATYDAESRIATALKSGVTTTYTYDSDGNRVKKTSGGSNDTLYWYMTPGIVAESDLSGATKSEYIFFACERVARRDFGPTGPTGVFYYFSDHLKTASVITDATGTIKAESDYYPWGGELQFVANDSNHYKFTGKERDTETGLDYFGARYYSNGLGRFVSADWSAIPVPVPYAEFGDPQSLNLYGYVRNIPTSKIDFDGHGCPPVCEAPVEAPPTDGTLTFSLEPLATGALAYFDVKLGVELYRTIQAIRNENAAYADELKAIGKMNQAIQQKAQNGQSQETEHQPEPQVSSSGAGSGQKGGKPYDDTPENLARIAQGKPPIGRDGKPVELHSPGQTHKDKSQELTRTDHRGKGNFKKNHPNTGQQRSKVDRSQAAKDRRAHWKKVHEDKTKR